MNFVITFIIPLIVTIIIIAIIMTIIFILVIFITTTTIMITEKRKCDGKRSSHHGVPALWVLIIGFLPLI